MKALILFIAAIILTLHCSNDDDGGMLYSLTEQRSIQLSFGLAGTRSTQSSVAESSAADHSLDTLEKLYPSLQTAGLRPSPELRWQDSLCIFSHPEFYFHYEQGLRFIYCLEGLAEKENEILSIFENVIHGQRKTADPVFISNSLRIRVLSLAMVRHTAGEIFLSVDGNKENPVLEAAGLEGDTYFRSSIPLRVDLHAGENPEPLKSSFHAMPRVFPDQYFHLLIAENSVLFLYPISGRPHHYLTLEIFDERVKQDALDFFLNIDQRKRDLLNNATREPFFVSEVFFGSQGGAGNEFIEIAAGPENSISSFQLHTAEGIIEESIFLFGNSVIDFSRRSNPPVRFHDFFSFAANDEEPHIIHHTDYYDIGASDKRTIVAAHSSLSETFETVFACLSENPCGSRGIHPIFHYNLPSANSCSIDDYIITEINPFGIIPPYSNSINAWGKFIEIYKTTDCKDGPVFFRTESAILDPGVESYVSTRSEDIHSDGNRDIANRGVYLFSAGSSYFESYKLPASNRSIKSTAVSELISLNPASNILAFDLTSGQSQSMISLPEGNYIYGNPAMTHSNFFADSSHPDELGSPFRRVHSLIRNNQGGFVFHPHLSDGLRGDLSGIHAMSPGSIIPEIQNFVSSDFVSSDTVNTLQNFNVYHRPQVFSAIALKSRSISQPGSACISEILPMGARNIHGTVPGDRFIEFDFSAEFCNFFENSDLPVHLEFSADAALYGFEVIRLSDGDIRQFFFPAPASRRFAIIRDNPECFDHHANLVRFRHLYLPASAGIYNLYQLTSFMDTATNSSEIQYERNDLFSLTIDSYTYSEMNSYIRRSLTGQGNEWILTETDFSSEQLCYERTRATPGLF